MSGNLKFRLMAALAVLFGMLTIVAGGSALFGGEVARAEVGNAVPFVLWFNFAAGFAYVVAGVGLWLQAPWGVILALLIAASTIVVFVAFGFHVLSGGAYEMRTIGALALRSLIWIAIAVFGWRSLRSGASS